ncbi:hypothetical protein B0H13DRAFT_1983728 [Mycena leptocephala]|nr:hypothetical protein B0H13DRAFT_1983728 [Mycena leptocephala]
MVVVFPLSTFIVVSIAIVAAGIANNRAAELALELVVERADPVLGAAALDARIFFAAGAAVLVVADLPG